MYVVENFRDFELHDVVWHTLLHVFNFLGYVR